MLQTGRVVGRRALRAEHLVDCRSSTTRFRQVITAVTPRDLVAVMTPAVRRTDVARRPLTVFILIFVVVQLLLLLLLLLCGTKQIVDVRITSSVCQLADVRHRVTATTAERRRSSITFTCTILSPVQYYRADLHIGKNIGLTAQPQ